MNGRRCFAVSMLCLLAVAVAMAQSPDDPLTDVKRLYASASYEDALAVLGRVSDHPDANEIDEYRALCFLGLDRTRDAEQAVERLVMRNQTSTYDLASHSPKFVSLYRAVKKRTLPVAAAALYGSAKASFEDGQFASASVQFKELVALLSDPEEAAALGDLRMLADGFFRLSEQRLAAVIAPAPEPLPAPPPAESMVAISFPKILKSLYGPEDLDVIPPVIVDQRMPAWVPPGAQAGRTFHGTLEVIIGKNGAVESQTMSEVSFPAYDWELLRVSKQWKYTPATVDGRPVKYRKVVAVTLGGS